MYLGKKPSKEVTGKDDKIIEKLKERPHSITYLAKIIGKDPETVDLTPLVEEGVSCEDDGVTPTDVLHVQGRYNAWNRQVAYAGIETTGKNAVK